MISDFIGEGFDDTLKIANKKHDLVAIRVYDQREMELPSIGLARLKDAESGKSFWVDTSDVRTRINYHKRAEQREVYLSSLFAKSGTDSIKIRTDQSYVEPLMSFFKKRGKR